MSRSNKLNGSRVITLLLLLGVVTGVMGRTPRFHGRKEFLPYTRNLPAIDKIELLKLKPRADRPVEDAAGGIVATKVLKGTEAQKLASLWRRQTYTANLAACHEPAYAIKFYSRGRLITYASVCWSCNSIYFITPNLQRTQSFAGGDKKGEELSEVFRLAFNAPE